jgi:hypothetical protein
MITIIIIKIPDLGVDIEEAGVGLIPHAYDSVTSPWEASICCSLTMTQIFWCFYYIIVACYIYNHMV